MTNLTKRGKVVQGTASAVAFLAGLGIVGANDYQDATNGASGGATPLAWGIFLGAVLVFVFIEALRYSK
jgi:hypothetical protein